MRFEVAFPSLSLPPHFGPAFVQTSFTAILAQMDVALIVKVGHSTMRLLLQVFSAVATLVFAFSASAQQSEKRIALVIGNVAYQAEALPT